VNEVKGYNSRLDPVQAAAMRVKLKVLDEWNARRAHIAARYTAAFEEIGLIIPSVPAWAEPAWHLYVVQHPRRDLLQKLLTEAGVGTLIHYPIPPHLQQAYAVSGYVRGQFPIAERMANQLLSLPIGPQLDYAGVDAVIAAVKNAAQLTAPNND
jgi:dTDP-4-amino-4,6-dideoxygalactose transaminase